MCMLKQHKQMDIMIVPTETGNVKIFSYGFIPLGSRGQVYIDYNGVTISVKGYHRKKAIIRAITRLNESLLNKKED